MFLCRPPLVFNSLYRIATLKNIIIFISDEMIKLHSNYTIAMQFQGVLNWFVPVVNQSNYMIFFYF